MVHQEEFRRGGAAFIKFLHLNGCKTLAIKLV
nr:MAG TPA: hypothetical protein [Caudoviricetes sp.]